MKNLERNKVKIAHLKIGGGERILVQSMTKSNPHCQKSLLKEIKSLQSVSCDLVRLAIPDQEAARVFRAVRKQVSLPLVADIHFDFRLALAAIDAGADKIRINPANLGSPENVLKVVRKAKKSAVAIRVGVNAGSDLHKKKVSDLVDLCLQYVRILERENFTDIVTAIKSSVVEETIEANKLLHQKSPFPIHLGLTEAGPLLSGSVKSAAALVPLLRAGIGDTIRVSLTAPSDLEVKVAREILSSVDKDSSNLEIVSCPTCGRTENNLIKITSELEKKLKIYPKKKIKIAIMGCTVNGPGEINEADLGILGGKKISLFRRGKFVKFLSEEEVVPSLLEMIKETPAK